MIPLSHLSFVQREQVKFKPKTQEKGLKIFHKVVAVGTGEGAGGKGHQA